MIKVVLTDYSFDSLDIEEQILEPLGCKIVASKRISPTPELARLVSDADHVITQFARINAEVIAAMHKVKVIVRYGVGVDNVDLAAAHAKGIPVCNVPDYCMDEVADQTLALILALTRQIVVNNEQVHAGRWGLGGPLTAMKALSDLTMGVLGFGRIGREVVHRLRAFKCRLLVHDPAVPAAKVRDAASEPVGLDDLLQQSDVLTLHCPSMAETRKIIRGETIARMKRGAILINVGRGDLVDSAALVEALQDGRLAGAGLDVFDPEPIPSDSPLMKMSNVVLSPHCASASVKAARRLRETTAGIVARACRGEPLPNVVNGL